MPHTQSGEVTGEPEVVPADVTPLVQLVSPTGERVVFDGKYVTAAGVSSGIDMALHLLGRIAGDATAQTVQLLTEYDPQPPYDAGSPDKAPAEIVAFWRGRAEKVLVQAD